MCNVLKQYYDDLCTTTTMHLCKLVYTSPLHLQVKHALRAWYCTCVCTLCTFLHSSKKSDVRFLKSAAIDKCCSIKFTTCTTPRRVFDDLFLKTNVLFLHFLLCCCFFFVFFFLCSFLGSFLFQFLFD